MVSSFYFLIVYPPRDSDISRLEGSIGPDNTVDDLVTLLYTADFFGSALWARKRNATRTEAKGKKEMEFRSLFRILVFANEHGSLCYHVIRNLD